MKNAEKLIWATVFAQRFLEGETPEKAKHRADVAVKFYENLSHMEKLGPARCGYCGAVPEGKHQLFSRTTGEPEIWLCNACGEDNAITCEIIRDFVEEQQDEDTRTDAVLALSAHIKEAAKAAQGLGWDLKRFKDETAACFLILEPKDRT